MSDGVNECTAAVHNTAQNRSSLLLFTDEMCIYTNDWTQ